MATAAPHVKLLRQLASAKDDYLSGAFDITWDGAKATLYLVFGRPSHAVFESDQAQIEGEAAIDALLAELPRTFVVSDWRRAMSPHETLDISIDELAAPFVRLAGSYADDPVTEEAPEWWSATDDSPDLPFGIADFPLLPGGRPLWAETSPESVHLAERLAELPPSILTLTGAKLRAAAVVSGGDIIDAVWIDSDDQARGESAGMAILGATKGSLAGYALDDPRVAEALTMLWRLPLAVSGVELSWLDPASMLAAFRADGLDRVLVIDAPVRGIALFSRGGLVAVYSETQRSAVASPERLRSLLSQARGRLSVMERKPRPVDSTAVHEPLNAFAFFEVDGLEGATAATATAAVATVAPPDVEQSVGPPAEAVPPAEAPDDAAPPALETPAAAVEAPPGAEAPPEAEAPPPPPPDLPPSAAADQPEAEPTSEVPSPTRRPKRTWWLFGTSRRGRSAAPSEHELEAPATGPAEAPAATSEEQVPASAGWSVRQRSESPQPPWYRIRESSEAADAGAAEPAPPAPVEAPDETVPAAGEAEATQPTAVEASEPTAATAEEPAAAEVTTEAEPAVAATAEPEAGDMTAARADDATPSTDVWAFMTVGSDLAAPDAVEPPDEEHAGVAAEGHGEEAAGVTDTEAVAEPAAAGAAVPEVHDHLVEAEAEAGATVEAEAEPEVTGAEHAEAGHPETEAATEPEPEPEPEAEHEPVAAREQPGASVHPVTLSRRVAPWSWPLANPVADHGAARPEPDEAPAEPVATADETDSIETEEPAAGEAPDAATEFFSSEEPVGSQYVDFDEVRTELVRIGIVWLGETSAAPVTALLTRTRPTIDDFVATIDTIRGLHLEGQDPASVQAMAREMHQQAAERLCGA